MSDGKPGTTIQDEIGKAYIKRTREFPPGGALTVAYAFDALLHNAPFPQTALRAWADILREAASSLEIANG